MLYLFEGVAEFPKIKIVKRLLVYGFTASFLNGNYKAIEKLTLISLKYFYV